MENVSSFFYQFSASGYLDWHMRVRERSRIQKIGQSQNSDLSRNCSREIQLSQELLPSSFCIFL